VDDKADAWQGCTHDSENPGNAWNSQGLWHCRRIKQISGDVLSLNYGTVYPALLKLEPEARPSPSGASRTTTQSELLQTDPR
jgi:PadR family transcriptional regulator, regulatory protein PadR